MFERLRALDRRLVRWMERYSHLFHRVTLGIFFIWLGTLKTFGVSTVTSLIAHVVYWGDPQFMVPILGWWEMAIGVCLLFRPLVRIALILLLIRLPGTALALILLPDTCFIHIPFVPTQEGQYLIKDMMLFSAALVIGSTIYKEKQSGIYH
jgi:uncharacterized membrane protein YkgB